MLRSLECFDLSKDLDVFRDILSARDSILDDKLIVEAIKDARAGPKILGGRIATRKT